MVTFECVLDEAGKERWFFASLGMFSTSARYPADARLTDKELMQVCCDLALRLRNKWGAHARDLETKLEYAQRNAEACSDVAIRTGREA